MSFTIPRLMRVSAHFRAWPVIGAFIALTGVASMERAQGAPPTEGTAVSSEAVSQSGSCISDRPDDERCQPRGLGSPASPNGPVELPTLPPGLPRGGVGGSTGPAGPTFPLVGPSTGPLRISTESFLYTFSAMRRPHYEFTTTTKISPISPIKWV